MDVTPISSVPVRSVGRPLGQKDRGPRMNKAELAERMERLQRSGALAGTSAKVMHALGDARYWIEIIGKLEGERNWEAVARELKFHQQQRDGRPAQQINVTSFGVQVTATEIEQARAIVKELRGTPSVRPEQMANTIEASTKPLMLSGDGGGKSGGE